MENEERYLFCRYSPGDFRGEYFLKFHGMSDCRVSIFEDLLKRLGEVDSGLVKVTLLEKGKTKSKIKIQNNWDQNHSVYEVSNDSLFKFEEVEDFLKI